MKRYGDCVQCGECCSLLRMTGKLGEIVSQHGSLDEAKTYYSFRSIKLVEANLKPTLFCLSLIFHVTNLTTIISVRSTILPKKNRLSAIAIPGIKMILKVADTVGNEANAFAVIALKNNIKLSNHLRYAKSFVAN